MTTVQAARLVPAPDVDLDVLDQEYTNHLMMAQRYHDAALEAERNETPGLAMFRYRAQIEMQAAVLCQGQIQARMLGAILHQQEQIRRSVQRSDLQ